MLHSRKTNKIDHLCKCVEQRTGAKLKQIGAASSSVFGLNIVSWHQEHLAIISLILAENIINNYEHDSDSSHKKQNTSGHKRREFDLALT